MQTQTLMLDIVPGGVPPVIDVTQYDTAREIKIVLLSRTNSSFSLSSDYTYEIRGTRANKTGFVDDEAVSMVDSRTLIFTTTGTMTAVAGECRCGILIFDGEEHIETINFIMQVHRASLEAETIVNDQSFESIVKDAVEEVIDEQGLVIDDQLETPGAAADAKVTGDEIRELKNAVKYVTPEMFGAKGDGTTDDTTSIQSAINSGNPVRFVNTSYKTGTITIPTSTDIDCGDAEFICTGSTLFDCVGTAENSTAENDYTANRAYSLSDTFTGIVYLVGNNNIFKQRSYYVGGSVEPFYNGNLLSTMPFNITGVSAYRLNPITVNIRNIKNVTFSSVTNAVVIKQTYCAFSAIENINMTNGCYAVIRLVKSYGCHIAKCHIDVPQYGNPGDNYYPLGYTDSCKIKISDCYVHCVGWHCIDGGGEIVCRGAIIENCRAYTDYGVPAIHNHENCIETSVLNCCASGIAIGALGSIDGCIVESNLNSQKCNVELHLCSIQDLGIFSIRNTIFKPRTSTDCVFRLDVFMGSGGDYTAEYGFKTIEINNVKNINKALTPEIRLNVDPSVTGKINYGTISIIDSDFINLTEAYCDKYPDNVWEKANAIEGTGTGRIVEITDGAENAPIKSFSATNDATLISRTGKNLFDSDELLRGSGWTVDENGVYSGLSASIAHTVIGGFLTNLLPYTGRLTISFDDEVDKTYRAGYIMVKYSDDTTSNKPVFHQSWTSNTLTTDDNKTITDIYFLKSNNDVTTKFRNFQIELGTSKTTYEEYDGVIREINNGETSSPLTTKKGVNKIFTNDGTVSVDYRVDTKMYIDNH